MTDLRWITGGRSGDALQVVAVTAFTCESYLPRSSASGTCRALSITFERESPLGKSEGAPILDRLLRCAPIEKGGTEIAKKRRRFSAGFKKKVALEALREADTEVVGLV